MYFRSFSLEVQDQLLFHFSGYGRQLSSKGHVFEKVGLDEIICPYDFRGEDEAETVITDKEFANIFTSIQKGVHFIWLSDSCHSKNLSRKHEIVKSKDAFNETRFRRFNHIYEKQQTQAVIPIASLSSAPIPLHGDLISRCSSHQLSADAYINNRFNVVLMHYLIKNLSLYGQNASMQEIIKYAKINLMENDYDQNPQKQGVLATHKFFQ